MSILTAIGGISMSLAFSRDAENCAKEIDTELERVRMNAMSRSGEFTLTINSTNHEMIMASTASGASSTIRLPSQVTMTFQQSQPGSPGLNFIDITDTQLVITFDGASGAVESVRGDTDADSYDNAGIIRIRCVNRDGSKFATVVLIRRTGKHYVEYV